MGKARDPSTKQCSYLPDRAEQKSAFMLMFIRPERDEIRIQDIQLIVCILSAEYYYLSCCTANSFN